MNNTTLPPASVPAPQMALPRALRRLRVRADIADFGFTDTAKREYVRGGYLLALEHLERLCGPR